MISELIKEIANCRVCEDFIDPNPVISIHKDSKILIIGQAPGIKVHRSGIPWDDQSGDKLRTWMNISKERFYNPEEIGIVPMGFCYPGKGKTGDLPPRKECASLWHKKILDELTELKLVLLIGIYAQNYYLKDSYKTLTENVKNFEDFLPKYFVLPHPSPRNNIWMKRNAWFEADVVPELKKSIHQILS